MIETFATLLFAHVLADFVLQNGWMVRNKNRPFGMAAHIGVVGVTLIAATGSPHPVLLAVVLAHLAIDLVKTFALPRAFGSFMADQGAHLLTLVLAAWAVPGLWAASPYADLPHLPALMVLLSGAILATRAGGFAIALLMDPWWKELQGDGTHTHGGKGLTDGGHAIGWLERGMIFLLVLFNQPEGIGFLIAAKSVLRFGTVGDDRAVSEYVIIGTLASFAWAIAVSFATVWLMNGLPPLGIPDLSP